MYRIAWYVNGDFAGYSKVRTTVERDMLISLVKGLGHENCNVYCNGDVA